MATRIGKLQKLKEHTTAIVVDSGGGGGPGTQNLFGSAGALPYDGTNMHHRILVHSVGSSANIDIEVSNEGSLWSKLVRVNGTQTNAGHYNVVSTGTIHDPPFKFVRVVSDVAADSSFTVQSFFPLVPPST